jgi:predicted DNA binding CopG/RHH family protein
MMKAKTKAKPNKLDVYEQSILDALDFKKLKRPTPSRQKKIHEAAKTTLRDLKSARANIRMNEEDLEAIRLMANEAGMPYQTLINHIIHLYVTGQLINAQEVKKLAHAGVFDRRKASNE